MDYEGPRLVLDRAPMLPPFAKQLNAPTQNPMPDIAMAAIAREAAGTSSASKGGPAKKAASIAPTANPLPSRQATGSRVPALEVEYGGGWRYPDLAFSNPRLKKA